MRQMKVTKMGIPLNFTLALLIGIFTANISVNSPMLMPDMLIFSLAVGLVLQEVILVQFLSVGPNTEYQKRLFQGNITNEKRLTMLFLPFTIIFATGILLLFFSDRSFEFTSILRILCVSVIFTLGVDPLFGLTDRDGFAVFGAAVVYMLIIGSAIRGYGELVGVFDLIFGTFVTMSLSGLTFSYLILSIRWTYYRLFCFNQIDEPIHVIIDSCIPIIIILLPSVPKLVSMLEKFFTGM
jgi:hypothetical protein